MNLFFRKGNDRSTPWDSGRIPRVIEHIMPNWKQHQNPSVLLHQLRTNYIGAVGLGAYWAMLHV